MDGTEYGSGLIPKRGLPTMVEYPNGHGSGHAGNATSRERQEREDAVGLTRSRQAKALDLLLQAGAHGLVVAEVEHLLDVGHGQASSALSHLHRAGRVVRLTDRRNTQELYVHPDYVNGRKESPYNPRTQRKHPRFHSDTTVMEAMDRAGITNHPENYTKIRAFLENLP